MKIILTNIESLKMKLLIDRWYNKDCTLGRVSYGSFRCFSLELPWIDNETNISCIPPGEYRAFKRNSPKNGMMLEFKDVPKRTYIQIHSGNYTSQIEGCVLVGDSIKYLNNDAIPDVTNSKNTLEELLELLPNEVTVKIT